MNTSSNPARWVLLALLLVVVLGVVLDARVALEEGPVSALRTQEALGGDEGSVDAFCGFAPCGMPLECN
jgi:hypothetical protein